MKPSRVLTCLAASLWFTASSMHGQTLSAPASFNVLVFSKTTMYRHASITNGIVAIRQLGVENNFIVDATEDSSAFTSANLERYKAVVFLSTSGDILNAEQQTALQNYLKSGGGLAGVHAAIAGGVATEGGWGWYGQLCCTEFTNHSAIVQAAVRVEDTVNPSTAHLPKRWVRTDEWYNFIANPRGKVRVLASLDETTYRGGTMGHDHPVAWCRAIDKGRFWYTALGHTEASYTEPHFLRHLLGGIQIAAGAKPADLTPNEDPHFKKAVLYHSARDPMEIAVKLDSQERIASMKRFLPATTFKRPMDMELGPDGALYVLEWGTQYNGGNADAQIVRIDYNENAEAETHAAR